MTGTVIDSGAGCTHVIPVSDGYVIGSAIHSIPIAGRDITRLVQQLMRYSPLHIIRHAFCYLDFCNLKVQAAHTRCRVVI